MKTLVIIPAFNEEKNIGKVISEVKKYLPGADILVVNDGSTDSTALISCEAGTRVLSHIFPLGDGAARQTGFIYGLKHGFDVIIQLDGDGQHDPSYALQMSKVIEENQADVAIGSRFIGETPGYDIQFFRRVGMSLFSFIASVAIKQKITDPTSGFRAVNRAAAVLYASELYPQKFPDADLIILTHKAGFRIKEVPVKMKADTSGKSIHQGFRPLYYIFKMFLSILVTILREAPKGGTNEP